MTTVRSSTINSASTGSAASVAAPAGITAGDVALVIVHFNGNITITDNNGSTAFTEDLAELQLNPISGHTISVFTRRIVGGDPSTYNFTGGASDRWCAVALAIQAPHHSVTYDPVATFATGNDESGSASSGNAASVTTLNSDALHIAVMAPDGGLAVVTPPGGAYTTHQNGGPPGQTLCVCSKAITVAGATGTVAFTWSPTNAWMSVSFALRGGITSAPAILASVADFKKEKLRQPDRVEA